jgi:hypothetical protein
MVCRNRVKSLRYCTGHGDSCWDWLIKSSSAACADWVPRLCTGASGEVGSAGHGRHYQSMPMQPPEAHSRYNDGGLHCCNYNYIFAPHTWQISAGIAANSPCGGGIKRANCHCRLRVRPGSVRIGGGIDGSSGRAEAPCHYSPLVGGQTVATNNRAGHLAI